jgi:hypothetical protein
MSDELKNNKRKNTKKSLTLKLFFLFGEVILLIFLYFLLNMFGANLILIILILSFVFLLILGPVLRGNQKRYYSKLFPKKNRNVKDELSQIKGLKKRYIPKFYQKKKIPSITLDFKYRKPFIRKCNNCGMILPNFTEKCPICGEMLIK